MPGFAFTCTVLLSVPRSKSLPLNAEFLCLRIGFDLIDAQSVGSLAACIAEPILSAGGLIDPPRGYLSALKKECKKRDVLYILDEAQTAFGRLGTMFAFEQDGGAPDILTLSKTMGGGIPIAATVTSPEIEKGSRPKRFIAYHFACVRSHAIHCRTLAVLDIIREENLAERSKVNGDYFIRGLKELSEKI